MHQVRELLTRKRVSTNNPRSLDVRRGFTSSGGRARGLRSAAGRPHCCDSLKMGGWMRCALISVLILINTPIQYFVRTAGRKSHDHSALQKWASRKACCVVSWGRGGALPVHASACFWAWRGHPRLARRRAWRRASVAFPTPFHTHKFLQSDSPSRQRPPGLADGGR